MDDITQWIARARAGEADAVDALFRLLYPELRAIAHVRLSRNLRDTLLSTTALVHECYLKLLGARRLAVDDRAHFLGYAASAMRSIIVDAARAARSERRGGGALHETLDTAHGDAAAMAAEDEVADVDAALVELARLDPRLVRVVEMRYFAGMTDLEIAQALGVTDRTVRRDWEKARALLAHALRG